MTLRLDQQVTFLYAEDTAASRRFYAEVLGLPLVLDQGSCALFGLPGDRAFLGVCRARGARPEAARPDRLEGGVVLTLVAEDLEGWHAKLVAAGAEVLGPPRYSEQYDVTGFFFRDPAGYLLEIQRFHDPRWPAAPGG